MFEAADTLLNIKLEVCLSEPVVLDTNIVPANMIYIILWARTQYLCQENRHTAHNPHTPIMKETINMAKASDPTDVVFHAKNAERLAAAVRGPRRGWYGCINGWTKGTDWGVEGICMEALAINNSKIIFGHLHLAREPVRRHTAIYQSEEQEMIQEQWASFDIPRLVPRWRAKSEEKRPDMKPTPVVCRIDG